MEIMLSHQIALKLKDHRHQPMLLGLSGGVDSVVLSHILRMLDVDFRCVHINHALQNCSNDWAAFCSSWCVNLGVECIVENIFVEPKGQGIEAAARELRYKSFEKHLKTNEILLTAHHQNDQAETFLLNLMRGSGSAGLAAMPMFKPIAQTMHIRPMLNIARVDIEAYAKAQQLEYIDDPSNQLINFDRNYMRHEIIPRLEQRFSAATKNIHRASYLLSQESETLQEMAEALLSSVMCGKSLQLDSYLSYSISTRWHLFKAWLVNQGVQSTHLSQKKFAAIENDVIHVAPDAQPKLSIGEVEIRRFQNRLWLVSKQPPVFNLKDFTFADGFNPKDHKLTLKSRVGGETIRLHGRTKKVKKLYQEAQVPPWLRDTYPLVFVNEECVGICLSDGVCLGRKS